MPPTSAAAGRADDEERCREKRERRSRVPTGAGAAVRDRALGDLDGVDRADAAFGVGTEPGGENRIVGRVSHQRAPIGGARSVARGGSGRRRPRFRAIPRSPARRSRRHAASPAGRGPRGSIEQGRSGGRARRPAMPDRAARSRCRSTSISTTRSRFSRRSCWRTSFAAIVMSHARRLPDRAAIRASATRLPTRPAPLPGPCPGRRRSRSRDGPCRRGRPRRSGRGPARHRPRPRTTCPPRSLARWPARPPCPIDDGGGRAVTCAVRERFPPSGSRRSGRSGP